MLETLQRTTRRGGLRSLYRGFPVSAAAIGGYKALYFGLYDTVKGYMDTEGSGASENKSGDASSRSGSSSTSGTHQTSTKGLSEESNSRGVVTPSNEAAATSLSNASIPGDRNSPGTSSSGALSTLSSTDWSKIALTSSGRSLSELFTMWVMASGVVYVATTITYPLGECCSLRLKLMWWEGWLYCMDRFVMRHVVKPTRARAMHFLKGMCGLKGFPH